MHFAVDTLGVLESAGKNWVDTLGWGIGGRWVATEYSKTVGLEGVRAAQSQGEGEAPSLPTSWARGVQKPGVTSVAWLQAVHSAWLGWSRGT